MSATATKSNPVTDVKAYREARKALPEGFTAEDVDAKLLHAAVKADPKFEISAVERTALAKYEKEHAPKSKASSGKGFDSNAGKGTSVTEAAKAAKAKKTETKKATAAKAGPGRGKGARTKGQMTFKDAAIKLLGKSKGPLSAKDITEKALSQKLIATGGATPVATMGVKLTKCPEFVKVKGERGIYDLKELNSRGSKTRPTAKA